tara:strand:+ start:210 stop:437 length:228 start_codon:yes stop_codon:yes gene_type:complete
MTQHKKQKKQNKSNNINLYLIVFVIIIGGLIYYFTSNKSSINNIENNIKSFENSILEDIRIINRPLRTKPFIRLG